MYVRMYECVSVKKIRVCVCVCVAEPPARGLHWDWVPRDPNPAGVGGLNFAAGGNRWPKQTLRELQDDGVNK